MTYVIGTRISASSLLDMKTIVQIAVAILCVVFGHLLTRWRDRVAKRKELDTRMLKIEYGIEKLASAVEHGQEAVKTSLAAVGVSVNSLKEVVEAHHKTAEGQYEFLVKNSELHNTGLQSVRDDLRVLSTSTTMKLDELGTIHQDVRKDVSDHAIRCEEKVILPLVKRVEVLEGVS